MAIAWTKNGISTTSDGQSPAYFQDLATALLVMCRDATVVTEWQGQDNFK